MHTFLELLITVGICASLSLAVFRILSLPLLNILRKLCSNEESAQFWMAYFKTMLLLAPLLLSLITQWIFKSQNPIEHLRIIFISCLTGLIFGLFRLERKITQHIPNGSTQTTNPLESA